MTRIDLTRFDLNLLVVLDALLAERHVGRAAEKLHLSQSATSHALGRLRAALGDPLLIRNPKGMEPTPVAVELGPRITALLHAAEAIASPRAAGLRSGSRRVQLMRPICASAAEVASYSARRSSPRLWPGRYARSAGRSGRAGIVTSTPRSSTTTKVMALS